MAFGEIFNPGMADARKQLEAERILPAPPPMSGPPLFELPDLGVDFKVTWSLDPIDGPGNDNEAAAAAPSSES